MSIGINGGNNIANMCMNIFGAANNSTSGSSFLADYASIRNGSYKKLMSAYYDKKDSVKSSYTSDFFDSAVKGPVDSAGLSQAQSAAESMQSSITKLMDKKNNVFKKDEDGNYDTEKIYNAINSFASEYNKMLNVSDNLDDERTLNKILSMARYTSTSRSALSYAGISFNERSEMVIDKDKFSKMDMNTVKNLFQGAGGYASQMLSKASAIQAAAKVSLSSASGTYGSSGSYNNYFSTGSLYKGWF